MKKIFLSLLLLFTALCTADVQTSHGALSSLSGAVNASYTCSPPFVSQAAKPLIHLVLDFTGSMGEHPYLQKYPAYDATQSFYGYFKQDVYYTYNTTSGYWVESNATCSTVTPYVGNNAGCVSGRLLNFVLMSKRDILRKILTGGKVTSSVLEKEIKKFDAGTYTDPTTHCVFDTATTDGKLTITRETGTQCALLATYKTTTGISIRVDKNAVTGPPAYPANTFTRTTGSWLTDGFVIGMTIDTTGFSSNNNKTGMVISNINATGTQMTVSTTLGASETVASGASIVGYYPVTVNTKVLTTTPADITGIVQSLYRVSTDPGYDSKVDPKVDLIMSIFEGTGAGSVYYKSSTTPATGKNAPQADFISAINTYKGSSFTSTYHALNEAQNYLKQVAMGTTNIPTGMSVTNKGNGLYDAFYDYNSLSASSSAASCRKIFVLLISDGAWNNGSVADPGTDPLVPAYSMHTTDLRPEGTTVSPLEVAMVGNQTATLYTVYTFGDVNATGRTGRNALVSMAYYGGFDDKSGDKFPYPYTATGAGLIASSTTYPALTANCNTSLNYGSYSVTIKGSLCHKWSNDALITVSATSTSSPTDKTFSRGTTGDFIKDGWLVGDVLKTAGFVNSANNGTFVITALASDKMTVKTDNGTSSGVNITTLSAEVTTDNTPYRMDAFLKVTGATKTFYRSNGVFALADGWDIGKTFTSTGFSNSGNNGNFTISAISTDRKTITCSTAAGMVDETATDKIRYRLTMDDSPSPFVPHVYTVMGGHEKNTVCNYPLRYDTVDKWNGVTQTGSNMKPRCEEWDKEKTGIPSTFYEATDGDTLKANIQRAVDEMVDKVSSATAASILGNNDNAGASLVQAMFYPERTFDPGSKASWLGEVQAYWYYLDPKLNHITIREDSDSDKALTPTADSIAQFTFDGTNTFVNLFHDVNGDGIVDFTTPYATPAPDDVKTLWQAGRSLYLRDYTDRKIYTNDPTVISSNAGSRMDFSTTNASTLQPYLDTSTVSGAVPTATHVINYMKGKDDITSYRNRTVTDKGVAKAWKLGDVINSTPRISSEVRLNSYNLAPPAGYSDSSYDRYIKSTDYNARGMVYVGANDGMMHAFKSGSNFTGTGNVVATIKNADGTPATDLGKEMWAFVPKNALPFLQYTMLPDYKHIYLVDGTPLLIDASIGMTDPGSLANPCTTDSTYHLCPKRTTLITSGTSKGQLDYTSGNGGTSWRTVLIGTMGLGGASRIKSATCTSGATPVMTGCPNAVPTPITHPLDATKGFGYSSIFALDVTAPMTETATDYPKVLWEFSDPRLGYTTSYPAVMRIKDTNETVGSTPRNGRWVVVVASGPTGPITGASQTFEGKSDQPLTIFVIDLKTGALLQTFNNKLPTDSFNSANQSVHKQVTDMPSSAFGASLTSSVIDVDKYQANLPGSYSDDALYIGYTRGEPVATPTDWNKGGVLRLLTYNQFSPANWSVSKILDGIGPVASTVTRLQDKTKHNVWLYFGTGRYFTKTDDPTNVQSLFGIKDPCFSETGRPDDYKGSFGSPCTTSLSATSSGTTGVTAGSGTTLVNQTSAVSTVPASANGWFINLAAQAGSSNAERVVTDTVASINGIITFSTFKPSVDTCSYGGTSSVWSVKFDNGGDTLSGLKGQILIQLSTGAFQQVDAGSAFTKSLNRQSDDYKGVPPKIQPAITTNSNHTPSRRILHIQER